MYIFIPFSDIYTKCCEFVAAQTLINYHVLLLGGVAFFLMLSTFLFISARGKSSQDGLNVVLPVTKCDSDSDDDFYSDSDSDYDSDYDEEYDWE